MLRDRDFICIENRLKEENAVRIFMTHHRHAYKTIKPLISTHPIRDGIYRNAFLNSTHRTSSRRICLVSFYTTT